MLGGTSMFAQLFERVKVYKLNDGGKWDDKGTGHVSLEYLERSEAVGLVVIDEETNQTLLIHRISADDIYRRQEDTIISWTDPEVATDLALSFQETMSCSYIWDQICSVQRSIQFPSVGALDPIPRPINDDLEHSGTSQEDGLPPVELSTLPQLVKAVAEVPSFDRDRVAAFILRESNYIGKIIDLFKICEDLENLGGLHMLFKIVKGIISLNDHHIFDDIFSEEHIMDIVGALEYDPELPSKQNHRAYLKDQVVFKEVVPIRDPSILAKIHQTYRIGFIKDVILPRVLDDQTFATFNSIMLFNNVAVVSALQNDRSFINELFSKLWSPNTTERGRRDLILFVQEFCNLSKHLQPALRNQLLGSLVTEGLFDIVTNSLQSPDETVRLSGSDILVVVSNHSPPLLRAFLVQQQDQTLFTVLIRGMLTPGSGGSQSQLLEIMRMLLDSDTMDPAQTDKFLDVFYEKYIDQLVEVLTAACPPKGTSAEYYKQPAPFLGGTVLKGDITPEFLMSICELMCFCVVHHRYRIKYYVMRNNVVEKILRLTRRKEKYLVVAAVRFLRTCIALKDEFYNRYLVKNYLFHPVIQSFVANGNRYNLLNSAVLELFDFIRKENITVLMTHLVEYYSEKLSGLSYAETFQTLKLKYEQTLEMASNQVKESGTTVAIAAPVHSVPRAADRVNQIIGPMPDLRKRKDERALDKAEEDYFNEESDEEDSTSAQVPPISSPQPVSGNGNVLVDVPFRGGAFGLVDYEDEDEDNPPGLSSSKEGSSDGRSEGVLLPALPISDPIWPEMEDVSGKRKICASLASQTPKDAAVVKRRKPDGSNLSDLTVVRAMVEKPAQAPLSQEAASGNGEGSVHEPSPSPSEFKQETKQPCDEVFRHLQVLNEAAEKEAKRLTDERMGTSQLASEGSENATKQPLHGVVERKKSPEAASSPRIIEDGSKVQVSVRESPSKAALLSVAGVRHLVEAGVIEAQSHLEDQQATAQNPICCFSDNDTAASEKHVQDGQDQIAGDLSVLGRTKGQFSESPSGVSEQPCDAVFRHLQILNEAAEKEAKRSTDERMGTSQLASEASENATKQALDEVVGGKKSPEAASSPRVIADGSNVQVLVRESPSKDAPLSVAGVRHLVEAGVVCAEPHLKDQEATSQNPACCFSDIDTAASEKHIHDGQDQAAGDLSVHGRTDGKSHFEGGQSSESPSGVSNVIETRTPERKDQSDGELGSPESQGVTTSTSGIESPNGHESRRRGSERLSEKETTTTSDCNGSLEVPEKVLVGVKDSSPQHHMRKGSDTKVVGLGNELLRGGTQTSPGPYTVR